MSDTILRQWVMLQNIPVEPRSTTASKLTRKLEELGYRVEKRTIERDLVKLENLFRLIRYDNSLPHQWSFPKQNVVRSIPGMDVVTAFTFHFANEFIRDFLPPQAGQAFDPYLSQARHVLHETGKHELKAWTSRVLVIPPGQRLHPPEVDRAILDTIYEGLLRQRQIALVYQPRNQPGKVKEHPSVSPLGLVAQGAFTYLVCRHPKGPDPYHLVLHRIQSAEILPERAETPKGFDLQKYVSEKKAFDFPVGGTIRLKAKFAPITKDHLLESPLSKDQTTREESDGWLRVTASVQDTKQLRWWLLSFGPRVEVVSPKSLRREIADELASAAEFYADRR